MRIKVRMKNISEHFQINWKYIFYCVLYARHSIVAVYNVYKWFFTFVFHFHFLFSCILKIKYSLFFMSPINCSGALKYSYRFYFTFYGFWHNVSFMFSFLSFHSKCTVASAIFDSFRPWFPLQCTNYGEWIVKNWNKKYLLYNFLIALFRFLSVRFFVVLFKFNLFVTFYPIVRYFVSSSEFCLYVCSMSLSFPIFCFLLRKFLFHFVVFVGEFTANPDHP